MLFHNNGTHTPEALKEILAHLEEEEYEVVPISELIYKDNYYVDPTTGAQIKEWTGNELKMNGKVIWVSYIPGYVTG